MNQIRVSFEAYKKSTFGGKQDKILKKNIFSYNFMKVNLSERLIFMGGSTV